MSVMVTAVLRKGFGLQRVFNLRRAVGDGVDEANKHDEDNGIDNFNNVVNEVNNGDRVNEVNNADAVDKVNYIDEVDKVDEVDDVK